MANTHFSVSLLIENKHQFPWSSLLGATLKSVDDQFYLISEVVIRNWPLGPLFTINNLDNLKSSKSLINLLSFESGKFVAFEPALSQTMVFEEFHQAIEAKATLIRVEIETAQQAIKNQFLSHGITSLWHLTHKDNVASIMNNGILNHYDAHKKQGAIIDISDSEVQLTRGRIVETIYDQKIHSYAPLYINCRNPMLSCRRNLQEHLCLLEIDLSVLLKTQSVVSDGNSSSPITKYYRPSDDLTLLPWDVLKAEYWSGFEDGSRKRCSEVLVYPKVMPEFITKIHCYSDNTLNYLSGIHPNISITRKLFF
jgi:hypothetical protein